MFFRELHDSEKPFPESEVSFAQRLFAELRPAKHRVSRLVVVSTESLFGKETQVVFGQSATSGVFKFLRESFFHFRPWNLHKVDLITNLENSLKYELTLSGTWKGHLPGSLKALSHVTVAQACGSWLP